MLRRFFFTVALYAMLAPVLFSCASGSKPVSAPSPAIQTGVVSPELAAKVPAGYDPKKHILLVAEMPRLNNPDETNKSVTRRVDNVLKRVCPYRYQIVPIKDIMSEDKYSDTSVYKYAILNSLFITQMTHTTKTTVTDINGNRHSYSISPSARIVSVDFSFYDRTTGQRYPEGGKATSLLDYTVSYFIAIIKKVKGS